MSHDPEPPANPTRHAPLTPQEPAEGVLFARSRRVATIDIGSNSLRLMVAELNADGTYELLDDEKVVTRLGRGTIASDRLDEGAMDDTARAVRTMRQIADGYGVEAIRAVATCAVREASNRKAFVRRIRDEAGVDVEVISGDEEARLAYQSVDAAFELGGRDVAVVDIGGGSTEILLCSDGIVSQVCSMSIGAVRLTEAVGSRGKTATRLQRMERIVREHLREHLGPSLVGPDLVIGTGGTFTALAAMHRMQREPGLEVDDPGGRVNLRGERLHRADVRRLLESLNRMSVRERSGVPGLSPDRAEIVVAGITIADTVMDRLGVNELQVHDGGVRDGLLLDMAAELTARSGAGRRMTSDRIGAARAFAERCNRDVQHSQQVERLALRIRDQLAAEPDVAAGHPGLGDLANRELLQAAAILHDTGYYISYKRHHKHSYHLIIHSGLPGFRSDELEVIACLARYHRRAQPKVKHAEYRRLRTRQRQTVRDLAAILRIAVGLDRTHAGLIQDVHVAVAADEVCFTVIADERPEADLWGAERKRRLFEKVYGVEVRFAWRPSASAEATESSAGSSAQSPAESSAKSPTESPAKSPVGSADPATIGATNGSAPDAAGEPPAKARDRRDARDHPSPADRAPESTS